MITYYGLGELPRSATYVLTVWLGSFGSVYVRGLSIRDSARVGVNITIIVCAYFLNCCTYSLTFLTTFTHFWTKNVVCNLPKNSCHCQICLPQGNFSYCFLLPNKLGVFKLNIDSRRVVDVFCILSFFDIRQCVYCGPFLTRFVLWL